MQPVFIRSGAPRRCSSHSHQHELSKPWVGTWNAVAEFHQKDGTLAYDVGTYKVSYTLEDTYLQLEVELHDKADPSRHHSFFTFITYNPVTQKYDTTFF